MPRFHVTAGGRRTTVSIDDRLAAYLALDLGCDDPTDAEAHSTVRQWLQAAIDRDASPGQHDLSQGLARLALDQIAKPSLKTRLASFDWL